MNNDESQRRGRWLARFLCGVLCASFTFTTSPAFESPRSASAQIPLTPLAGVLSPELQRSLETAQPADRLRIIVRFKQQADLSRVRQAAGASSPSTRSPVVRAAIVDALRSVSSASQNAFGAFLASPTIADQVDTLRPFWIFNGMALNASPQAVRAIAARADVASVSVDELRKWIETPDALPPAPTSATITVTTLVTTPAPSTSPLSRTLQFTFRAADTPASVPWGIAKIRADQVWSGLGITGAGVTVATIDSGVDWQHPALQTSYRGWRGAGFPADHLHNWFDATNEAALYPTDLNGHGTHTMGTIVGQVGIGVAPGARWMAAKGLDSQGLGLFSWLHAAFQYMLAPGGDPNYAPDLVSNSWGSNDGTSMEFYDDIAALRAAGIFVLFANGNAGPNPSTVGSPASLPDAIGVGATDPDDDITYFSSRGPSPFGEVRPQISAPGLSVLSAFPGGRFATASGTSMATPHVAGTVALLLSANPSLDISATLYALTNTTVARAAILPSNDSGWGRVDAYNAVLSVLSTGVLTGAVLDGVLPISGALVTAYGNSRHVSGYTDSSGHYSILAVPGIYTSTASAYGYFSATSSQRLVAAGKVAQVDFSLAYMPSGIVRGTVQGLRTSVYLTSAVVRAMGTPRSSLAGNGSYPPYRYVLDLPAGTYTLEVRLLGYLVQTRTVTVMDGAVVDANFQLTPTQRIAFVDTGPWYYGSAAPYYRSALDAMLMVYDEYRVKHVPEDTPTLDQLSAYDTIIWSAPFDSPAFVGAEDTISTLLKTGHNLVISGQDIAFYDGGGFFNPRPYFSKLNASFVADNTPSRVVLGPAGSLLAGKVLTIAGGDGANNQALVDVVSVRNPDYGQPLGRYSGEQNGYDGAGVYSQQCLNYRVAYFAFGFESIYSATERTDVMKRVLSAFNTFRPASGAELLSRDNYYTDVPIGLPGQTVTHAIRLRNTGEAGVTDTLSLALSGNGWSSSIDTYHVRLAPCASTVVALSVAIPATATWNIRDVVTVTATSANSPLVSTSISFTSKTPASILLVDADRFYNREQDYIDALAAGGNVADRWDKHGSVNLGSSPPITTLRMYPTVIWFNGYDWFSPINTVEEDAMRQYLDGGGRLFYTSQAALAYTELSSLNQSYFGIASIGFDDVTSNVVGAPGNVLGDGFTAGTMLPFPYGWNLSSSIQPLPGTLVFLRGDSRQPFGLARECPSNCAPKPAWRTVFVPFAFEALPSAERANLMNRIVGWLSWFGQSSFVANHTTLAAGDAVTYMLVLRADDVITPALRGPVQRATSLTTTVSISVPLDANLSIISSTLNHKAAHYAGDWSGTVHAGDILTWSFAARSTSGLGSGKPLTATMFVKLDTIGVRFSRDSIVYINTPILSSSLSIQPATATWNSVLTLTLHVVNNSGTNAPTASLVDAVPTGLTLITPSLSLVGNGIVMARGNRIDWLGGLNTNQGITLTYQVSVPVFTRAMPPAFYNTTQINNGAGTVTQSALWIAPRTITYWLPVMTR